MAEKTKSTKASGKTTKKSVAVKAAKKIGEASTTSKAPTKLNQHAKRVATFHLHDPYAKRVFVAGSFNKWSAVATPLVRDEEGMWTGTAYLDPGDYEYRFIVDGVWTDDPASKARRCNEFGTENCILTVKS
jgi:1,4-alpha-glucan branching enzyme